jgi:UDP-N-acetylmuramoyl-L-alanyl-D-glutamate--2,6-diaminopimelate ligase
VTPVGAGSRFILSWNGAQAPVRLPLPGKFNVSNALAASALALTSGVPFRTVATALSEVTPPPGRLERVDAGQPFELFVDYAHTMHAFRAVLTTLRERTPPPHRLIAIFGAAGDRDRAKRPVLARLARTYADFFVITNEDPYSEEPEAIIAEIAAGLPQEEDGVCFIRELDRFRAISLGIEMARPGDAVVILGKGHEQSMVVNGRKEPWSDASAAREALMSRR